MEQIKKMVADIEAQQPPKKTGKKVEDARAEGFFDGQTQLASQLRAILDEVEKKKQPMVLLPGMRVRIINGPYCSMYGVFKQLVETPLGDLMALVVLDHISLEVEVESTYLDKA